jgi:hypothetical protein
VLPYAVALETMARALLAYAPEAPAPGEWALVLESYVITANMWYARTGEFPTDTNWHDFAQDAWAETRLA